MNAIQLTSATAKHSDTTTSISKKVIRSTANQGIHSASAQGNHSAAATDFAFPSADEEHANAQTHFGGIILTLLLGGPLISLSLELDWTYILGTCLFVAGMLAMYTCSTLYHAATDIEKKKRLRILDHSSIYVMIAGSYSIICTSVLGGWMGWSLFAFLWTCTIAGIIGKFIAIGKHPRLSLLLYLMMGWVALIVIVPLWRALSHLAFALVIAEGLAYTIGAYFFKHDEEHAHFHAIWHIFILLGSIFHLLAVMLILVNG